MIESFQESHGKELMAFLKTLRMFSCLSNENLSKLSKAAKEISCKKGETVFKQGEEGDNM